MTVELGAIVGVGLVAFCNLVLTAFWAGGLNQKVADHDRRLEHLENGGRARAHYSGD